MAHLSYRTRLLNSLLFCTLLNAPFVSYAGGYEIKSEKVESKALRLPKVDIDTVDYAKVQFEYAVAGKVIITSTVEESETLNCHGKEKESTYLRVNYRGPDVIFRIKDYKDNYVLHADKVDTDSQTFYGQNNCNNTGNVLSQFEQNLKAWKRELNKQAIQGAIKEMEAFIANDTAPVFQNFYFPIFYVASNSSEFQIFDKAYKLFQTALDRNRRIGPNFNAQEEYVQVAEIWERELKKAQEKGDRNDIVLALHRNLSSLYFFSMDYSKALTHEEKALARGLAQKDSRKDTILDYQTRAAYSPRAASDIIRQLKAWRSGDDIIRFRKLVEVEYQSLKDTIAGIQ